MYKRLRNSAAILACLVSVGGCACDQQNGDEAPGKGDIGETECADGKDNDSDGVSDCADLDCRLVGGSCELAPPLDRSVASTLAESARFLYEGDDPIQKDVEPGAFDRRRIAIVRGSVVNRGGKPLAGARVSVLGHPEFGYTLTRPDGVFDLAVNGGGKLALQFHKEGFLAAERAAEPGWQRYARVPEVGLIEESRTAGTVEADAGKTQALIGEKQQDGFGTRQPLVLFKPKTKANVHLPDGSNQELSSLTVRVTEYPFEQPSTEQWVQTARFAPGTLPSSGGLHYGLEFTVEEAAELEASQVSFSTPVSVYVENFLGLPVGAPVPLGFYDRAASQWQGGSGGRVIKVLGTTGGTAVLDADGDDEAEDEASLKALDVSASELVELGKRYSAGTTLWRAQVDHFSPWNMVFPVVAPIGAAAPSAAGAFARPLEVPSRRGPVLVEPQAVTQSIGIAGTPFSLHYQSDRTVAYGPGFQIEVPVTSAELPAGVRGVLSSVHIAGREYRQYFDPATNLKHVVIWDGKDAFGRLLQGPQTAQVTVSFVFDGVLQLGSTFGASGTEATLPGFEIDSQPPPAVLSQTFEVRVGVWDAKGYELGGFGLDVLHAYDPAHRTVFFGSGDLRVADNVALVVRKHAKSHDVGTPDGVTIAPDGTVIVTDDQETNDTAAARILSIDSHDSVTVLAGPGAAGAAASIDLSSPQGIARRSDGTLIVADFQANAVRSISPGGTVQTLIGVLPSANPLVHHRVDDLDGIALGPREELYVVNADQVLKLEGGRLSVFAGGGTGAIGIGDEGPASQAVLAVPSGIAVAPDGSVFVSEREGHRVRKITPDGTIRTVAGSGTAGFSGDGQNALTAELNEPRGLALAPDGSLYIADQKNNRIRRVTLDGLIQTAVGGGELALEDGQLAEHVRIESPDGIAFGSDGALHIASVNGVFRVAPGLPQLSDSQALIPSEDGRTVYQFDSRGKHQATLDALTGVTELEFSYDELGRLASVLDKNGLVTRVERRSDGKPSAIVAPFGQRTSLELDAQGAIGEVTDPLGSVVKFAYDARGLLEGVTDRKRGEHRFAYDALGYVESATDSTGYTERFARATSEAGWTVTATSPENRTTTYPVHLRPGGGHERGVRLPDAREYTYRDALSSRTATAPDGTTTTTYLMPDLAFGPQSPNPSEVTVKTPSGRTLTTYLQTGKRLADVDNALTLEEWNQLVEVNGRVHETLYTRSSRTLTSMSPMGRTTKTVLDELGRPVETHAPGLGVERREYDDYGRLKRITRTAGDATRSQGFSYDGPTGFLASATNPRNETTSYERDAIGRLLGIQRPDQSAISWELDGESNLLSLTPPGRAKHHFLYQGNNDLLVATVPPVVPATTPSGIPAGETHYHYDSKDLDLTHIERSDGRGIRFRYSAAGQLETITLADATVSYSYDQRGSLAAVNRTDGVSVELSRDGPLWTGTTWSGAVDGTVSATYDDSFRLESLTVNDVHTVKLGYDDDGFVTSASASAGVMTVAREPATAFVSATSLGSVTTAHEYNGFGELAKLTATLGTLSRFGQSLERDELGRVTHITETIAGETHETHFQYDNVGRLVEVDRDGVITTYRYDPNGNRTAVLTDGIETATGSYDEQDRIQRYGAWEYTQSAHGDLLRRSDGARAIELTYDELGNLTRAFISDGVSTSTIDYVVDGFGRRVAKRAGGQFARAWLYQDQLRPAAEITSAGVLTHFVYTEGAPGGAPDAMFRAGVPYRLVKDHLGSVRLVINASTGAIAQRLDYDEFGRVLLDTNPAFQPFGFAGGLYDPDTKLVRFGARDYDPGMGRWTAKDPIGFNGGDTNVYAYCGNDPVNFVDDTGREASAIVRKAWRATQRLLRLGGKIPMKKALHLLEKGEGVYVATREEAAEVARAYSRMKGGGGKIEFEGRHMLRDGRIGYDHVHALDAKGKHLDGHIWYGDGGDGALAFILDLTGDGLFDFRDIFELANPNPFGTLFGAAGECDPDNPNCT